MAKAKKAAHRPPGWGDGRVFQKRTGGPWYYALRVDGHLIRKKVGTEEQARKTLEDVRLLRKAPAQHRALLLPVAQPTGANLLARKLLAQFLRNREDLGRRGRTIANYQTLIEGFLATVNHHPKVTQITQRTVSRFIELRREQGASTRRVKHALTALGTMLRWAEREGLIGVNPVPHMPRVDVTPTRLRRSLTDSEVARLLEASRPPRARYDRIWAGFLTTGLRRAQLSRLVWEDIDLKSRTFRIRASTAKTRRTYTQPILPEFEDVLRELWAEAEGKEERVIKAKLDAEGEWTGHFVEVERRPARDLHAHVFLNSAGAAWGDNLLRRFDSCLERAGISKETTDEDGNAVVLDIHCLRYTFVTGLRAKGLPSALVEHFSQHAGAAMSEHYTTFDPGQLTGSVKLLRLLPKSMSPRRAPAKHVEAKG